MIGKTNSHGKTIKGENLNISLITNQSDHSDLNGATITVSYGEEEITKVWNGNIITVKVPTFATYTVSVSEVEGYSIPASVSDTAIEGNSKSLNFTYNTEIVNITLSADNGLSVNGASVTITEPNRSLAYTWNGTSIAHKVAYGTSYTISVSDVTGLGTPEQQTGTANSVSKPFNFVYSYTIIRFIITSDLENDPILEDTGVIYYLNAPGYSPVGGIGEDTFYGGHVKSGDWFNATVGRTHGIIITMDPNSVDIYENYGYTISDNANDVLFEAPYLTTYYNIPIQPGINEVVIHFTPPIANGVYICDDNGNCYDPTTTGVSNAVGVAVVTDNCCFIMGLSYAGGIPWLSSAHSSYSTDIEGVPTSTNATAIGTYYYGNTYTNYIIDFANTAIVANSLNCAAYNARSQSISFDGRSVQGYLGSAGEWQAVINNYQAVQTALTNAGGFTLDWDGGTYYWTSCEYNGSRAWYAYFLVASDDFGLRYHHKDTSDSYRCVVPFYIVNRSQLTLA